MNLYEILGIPEQSDSGRIKQAYRKLAKKYHPDLNPEDREAERHFKEAADAYEILGNPEKRKKYDSSLKNAGNDSQYFSKRKPDTSSPAGPEGNWSVWDDLMRRMGPMAGGDTGRKQTPRPDSGAAGDAAESGHDRRANPIDVTGMFEKYMKMK